jgi:uncharacterized membrane protein HdeD (DUF308 family)
MADVTAAVRGLWWLVLLRGILAILFGLFALFTPGTALLALVFVFGAYAILDGVTALVVGIRHRGEDRHWVWHVVQGVVSVLAGIIAFVWPGVTVLAILFVLPLARTFLRHLRLASKAELKERILLGIAEINAAPVVHQWKNFDLLVASSWTSTTATSSKHGKAR